MIHRLSHGTPADFIISRKNRSESASFRSGPRVGFVDDEIVVQDRRERVRPVGALEPTHVTRDRRQIRGVLRRRREGPSVFHSNARVLFGLAVPDEVALEHRDDGIVGEAERALDQELLAVDLDEADVAVLVAHLEPRIGRHAPTTPRRRSRRCSRRVNGQLFRHVDTPRVQPFVRNLEPNGGAFGRITHVR
jgi:radical SAM superfamily enzyme YgiQ (UPF0313 family)